MIIDCTEKVITQWKENRHYKYLEKYNQLLGRKTDVTIPIYKLQRDDFETIWPPYAIPHKDCNMWKEALITLKKSNNVESEIRDYRVCGDFGVTAIASVAFLNDGEYNQYKNIDFIKSPGIYIKDPVKTTSDIFEFILAYNIHLAETYYLYNRNVAKNKDASFFNSIESFLISLSTLRSINEVDQELAMRIREKYSHLIGSWKVPFILLNRNSINDSGELSDVLNTITLAETLSELLSGECLDVFEITTRLNQSLIDYNNYMTL